MNTELETITEETPVVRPQFSIESDSSAEWLLRKLANNAAEKIRITAQAHDILEALDADTADLMFRHGAALEHYCREKLAAEGNRRKSVRFLQATCSFRYQGPAVRLKDHAAALLMGEGERACPGRRGERGETGHRCLPTGGRSDPDHDRRAAARRGVQRGRRPVLDVLPERRQAEEPEGVTRPQPAGNSTLRAFCCLLGGFRQESAI